MPLASAAASRLSEGEKSLTSSPQQRLALQTKSIGKPFSPSLQEEPCLPKPAVPGIRSSSGGWSWRPGWLSRANFRQKQSRPAAVVLLLAFLWQIGLSLCAGCVSLPPPHWVPEGCGAASAPGLSRPKGRVPPAPPLAPPSACYLLRNLALDLPSPGSSLCGFPARIHTAPLNLTQDEIQQKLWDCTNKSAKSKQMCWRCVSRLCINAHTVISLIHMQAHSRILNAECWAFRNVVERSSLKYLFYFNLEANKKIKSHMKDISRSSKRVEWLRWSATDQVTPHQFKPLMILGLSLFRLEEFLIWAKMALLSGSNGRAENNFLKRMVIVIISCNFTALH